MRLKQENDPFYFDPFLLNQHDSDVFEKILIFTNNLKKFISHFMLLK